MRDGREEMEKDINTGENLKWLLHCKLDVKVDLNISGKSNQWIPKLMDTKIPPVC